LTIIGSGNHKAKLEEIVKHQNLTEQVKFSEPINYGSLLFSELAKHDFLLAAPRSEDTPRSAFDSMACGLPILAYDTYYYKDLEKTGAVKTAMWLSVEGLASLVLETKRNISQHQLMITNGIEFAKNNTQMIWLEQRQCWQIEFLG
jgi:glycosyltransferase involved in cell wall biosynthesis